MATYYVGWDVGAWYCDTNTKSRDAISVLNENRKEVYIKREVVRRELNENSIFSFLNKYFGGSNFEKDDIFIFAIDAVFSLPYGVQQLLSNESPALCEKAWQKGNSIENGLLYRITERVVKEKKGQFPKSVLQDMIGSQATKIMFFLNHFGFIQQQTGVWQAENGRFTAIETYPSILGEKGPDVVDAKLCAELAYTFANNCKQLYSPQNYLCNPEFSDEEREDLEKIIRKEGWIWFPESE